MATAADRKRFAVISKRFNWAMGDKPVILVDDKSKSVGFRADPIPEKIMNSVLFNKEVYCRVYVPVAYEDEPLNHKPEKQKRVNTFDPTNGILAYYDYIKMPAKSTVADFVSSVNKFYKKKVGKTNPLFQSTEGQKLVGKTYQQLLHEHCWFTNDLTFHGHKKEGLDIIAFGVE